MYTVLRIIGVWGLLALVAVTPTQGEAAVRVIGADRHTITLTEEEFQKLPRMTLEAVDHLGDKAKYTGVSIHHLLAAAKVPLGSDLSGPALRLFVRVEAHDDYQAVFALPEFDSAYTDRTIILADQRDSQPLPAGKGPWQVIVPGEKRQARWVRMVKTIRVLNSDKLQESKP
jgi:hypothetical protein